MSGASPPSAAASGLPSGYRFTLAKVLRVTAAKLLIALFRVRVEGTDLVPASGGAVLAGNHVSYMDPVLMWCVSPRPVHFMAKGELFRGIVGWFIRRIWAFPVDRSHADRAAITTATELLRSGELVGIFPEGTRHDGEEGLGEAHGGVAFIAMRADVPVVPVAVVGTDEVWPRGRKLPRLRPVTIRFGDPLSTRSFSEGGRKERTAAMTDALMCRIAEELDEGRRQHARRGR